MRLVSTLALSLVAFFAFSTTSFAEAPANAHPCQALKAACSAAGYFKGGWKQGKGIYKNCMQPLLAGQQVQGVNDPADVSACQLKKAKK